MKKLLVILLTLLVLVGCSGGAGGDTAGGDAAEAAGWKLQNENVRKAISYALDREAIVKSLNDGSVAAEGIIPKVLASNPETGEDYRDEVGKIVDYNLDTAKEYYAAACGELGVDSISLDLLYGTNEGDSVIKAAEQIAYYLEEVGFSVNLVQKQKKERLALAAEGDFEIMLTRWGPDYGDPQTYMDLFISSNYDNNYGHYASTEYDTLVKDAEAETDLLARWNKFIEAEKQLVATDAGVVPVFQAGGAMIIRPGVSGFQFHSAFVDDYRHIVGQDAVTVVKNTDVLSWDSCIATDGTSFEAQTMVLGGLMQLDAAGNPFCDLAESYEMSEDGTTYTFKIRDNANWSNGTPVTAADFVFAWDRLGAEETASEYSWWLDTACVDSYTAIDDKTLEVKLTKTNALFLQLVAFPSMFPINEEFYTSCGDTFATSADTMLFCGPYTLVDWTSGYACEFALNDDYWDAETYKANGAAKKVVFRALEDTQTALMEYEAGNVDTVILSGEQVTANETKDGFINRLQGYLFYLQLNIDNNVD